MLKFFSPETKPIGKDPYDDPDFKAMALDTKLYDILGDLEESGTQWSNQDSLIDTVIFLLPKELKTGNLDHLKNIIKLKAALFIEINKYTKNQAQPIIEVEKRRPGRPRKNV